ncbi:MAG: DUF1999 family protein [Deinococcota bacterium]|nr:DUF1999 family protein [Deinococcota bacterium]
MAGLVTAGLVGARPLGEDDGEALAPIDQAYALRYELEPALTRSSLAFFLRAGHAFAAYLGGEARGFALAQAVWNGTRPTVYLSRLAAMDSAGDAPTAVLKALVEAVTKSAYDAAVYDLIATVPESDEKAAQVLREAGYGETSLRLYGRVLGSRG